MNSKHLTLSAIGAAVVLWAAAPGFATTVLGSAQSYAVLGGSSVTNTGPTILYGDLGISPLTSITGFFGTTANEGPGMVTGGVVHQTDAAAGLAQSDALTAYNTLKALPFTIDLTGQDLGHYHAGDLGPLAPGVYKFSSTAQLTGALTLDFATNPGGEFVFQIGTALTTASGSSVDVINGSPLSGVYWLMGVTGGSGTGSATLGSGTVFAGNILALDSISFDPNAGIVCGRAIALNAAVTMINNRVSNNNTLEDFDTGRSDFGSLGFSGGGEEQSFAVPEPLTLGGVFLGVGGLCGYLRRRASR